MLEQEKQELVFSLMSVFNSIRQNFIYTFHCKAVLQFFVQKKTEGEGEELFREREREYVLLEACMYCTLGKEIFYSFNESTSLRSNTETFSTC